MAEQGTDTGEIETGLKGALGERVAETVGAAGDAAAAEQRSQATGGVGPAVVGKEDKPRACDSRCLFEQLAGRGREIERPCPTGASGRLMLFERGDAAAEIDLIPAEQAGLDGAATSCEHERQNALSAAEELREDGLEFVVAGVAIAFLRPGQRWLWRQIGDPASALSILEHQHGGIDSVLERGRCFAAVAVFGGALLQVADEAGQRLIVHLGEQSVAIVCCPDSQHVLAPGVGMLIKIRINQCGDGGGCGDDASAAGEQVGGQAVCLDGVGAQIVDDPVDLNLPIRAAAGFSYAVGGRLAGHHALRSKGNAPVARAIVIVPGRNQGRQVPLWQRVTNSGRLDLNQRPLDPQSRGAIYGSACGIAGYRESVPRLRGRENRGNGGSEGRSKGKKRR